MCLNPQSVVIFKNPKTGKQKVLFNKPKSDFFKIDDEIFLFNRYETIPCGKCCECLEQNSKQWAVRLMCEQKYSKFSYFLTLTYDDLHLPKDGCLKKDDIQHFIKLLRDRMLKNYGIDNIRYYLVGEYGSKSRRPHYHIILFNCPLTYEDFKILGIKPKNKFGQLLVGKSAGGDLLRSSEFLSDIWNYGFNQVGSVNFQSCAYVARYCNKKRVLSKEEKEILYKKLHLVPEFSLMSKKPGIGLQYFDEHKDSIIKNNFVIYENGHIYSAPRYFRSKLDSDDKFESSVLENFKKNSKFLSSLMEYNHLINYNGNYRDYKIKLDLLSKKKRSL